MASAKIYVQCGPTNNALAYKMCDRNSRKPKSVDFEKVLKEKLSEETFSIISSNEKEFGDWMERLKREAERCGELYRELESMKNAAMRGE